MTEPPGSSPDDDDPPSSATADDGARAWRATDDFSWEHWQWDRSDHGSGWGSWGDSSWNWGDRRSWQPYDYYNNYRSGYQHHGPWGYGSSSSFTGYSHSSSAQQSRENDEEQKSNDNSEEPGTSDSSVPDEAFQDTRRPSSAARESTEATRASSDRDRDDPGLGLSDNSGMLRSKGSFSEKMAVPTFGASGSGDELGVSARSYLRQVEAWSKVTRTDPSQQALLLYQNLSGRAWVESEELNVEDLASPHGLKIFKAWIRERYQEVEVSRIAEALTLFFKKMKEASGTVHPGVQFGF